MAKKQGAAKPPAVNKRSYKDRIFGALHAMRAIVGKVDSRLEPLTAGLGRSNLFKTLEYLGRLSVALAVVTYVASAGERTRTSHYQAWQVINLALGTESGGGRVDALEGLAQDDVSLAGVDLSRAWLRKISLPGADLYEAQLNGAILKEADLRGADLRGAHLEWDKGSNGKGLKKEPRSTILWKAHLEEAQLDDAHLWGAVLGFACLQNATLNQADLRNAYIANAHLEGASLWGANLESANLKDVHLQGSHLEGADLSGTCLIGADLTSATVTQAQIDTACVDGTTKLPGSLKCPQPCAHPEVVCGDKPAPKELDPCQPVRFWRVLGDVTSLWRQ